MGKHSVSTIWWSKKEIEPLQVNNLQNGNIPYTKMSDTYPLSAGFLEQISLFVTNKP